MSNSRFCLAVLVAWTCLLLGSIVGMASSSPLRIDNVIFIILDGVGSHHYELTRLAYGELCVDGMYQLGWVTTSSADSEVTESPAAATALATGHKTNDVMVAVSPDGQHLKTVLEHAQDRGMRTGLITTVMIYDATPAAFAAHSETRYNHPEIAAEMLEQGVDVLLGGGRTLFQDEDLVPRAEQLGYAYVESAEQLRNSTAGKLLGLFAPVDMSFELDRHLTSEPSIAAMTAKAIEILSTSNAGFFLMVEGGKADWASHRNDAASVAADLKAFDDAVRVAIDFAETNGRTLVVVTSDHETGGLTFREADRSHIAGFLADVTASADHMGAQFDEDRTNVEQVVRQFTPIDQLTPDEVRLIQESGSGFQAGKMQPGSTIAAIICNYARTAFSSTYHTASDVPLFWYGAGAFPYSGICDNTDVGRELVAIVTESDAWATDPVEWDVAPEYDGTYQAVIGDVAATGLFEGSTFIDLGNMWPNEPRLAVVISPDCERLFTERFGERPVEFFDRKTVVVYGEIVLNAAGIPYMHVCDPYAIRVITGDASE